MTRASQFGSTWQETARKRTSPGRRRLAFEPLEDRTLLSGDFGYGELVDQQLLLFDNFNRPENFEVFGLQWPQPAGPGTQTVITYSYSNLLDGTLGGGLADSQLRAAVEEAFGLWASVAPLNFVEVVDDASLPEPSDVDYDPGDGADIRIGHHVIDGIFGVLAHAFIPFGTGPGTGLAGDVHFDSDESWSIGNNAGIDIVEVALHELGHSLGLGHEFFDNAIMNPFFGGRFNGLGTGFLLADDIAGIQSIYGAGVGSVTPLNPDDIPADPNPPDETTDPDAPDNVPIPFPGTNELPVGRDPVTGQWISVREGVFGLTYNSTFVAEWDPGITWADTFIDDFDSNGVDDFLGRNAANGNWQLTRWDGSNFRSEIVADWDESIMWVDVDVGNFDGDGQMDLIGRDMASGDWWVTRNFVTGAGATGPGVPTSNTGTSVTDESNDTIGTAIDSRLGPGTNPGMFTDSGIIGDNPSIFSTPELDIDLIAVQLNAGDRVTIDIDAATAGSSLDSILRLFNSSGIEVAFSDDNVAPGEAISLDSFIDFTAGVTDTYYVGVSGFDNVNYDPFVLGSGSVFFGGSTGSYDIKINTTVSDRNERVANFNPAVDWIDFNVADINGNGRAEIIARAAQTGNWWAVTFNGTTHVNQLLVNWNPNVTFLDVQVADVDGNGIADLVGRVAETGNWWSSNFNGVGFLNRLLVNWNPNVNFVDVQIADVDGDGIVDLVGRVASSGRWWATSFNGGGFMNQQLTVWRTDVTWLDVVVGDANDDGKADLFGRIASTGRWWAVVQENGVFTNLELSQWDSNVIWADVGTGDVTSFLPFSHTNV